MAIDYEDVQYEDSVSSDTGGAFDGEPAMTWEEDPSQYVDFPAPEMSEDDMVAMAEAHYEDQLANWSETGH